MASLIYWPKTSNALKLVKEDNKNWVSVIRDHKVFLLRIDKEREFTYRDMDISIGSNGDINITTTSGLTAFLSANEVDDNKI